MIVGLYVWACWCMECGFLCESSDLLYCYTCNLGLIYQPVFDAVSYPVITIVVILHKWHIWYWIYRKPLWR